MPRIQAGMDFKQWEASLADPRPPTGLHPLAEALWWEARGNWKRAHTIAQDVSSSDGAWVHAYLHRREGDAMNSRYWYRRAGKPACDDSLESEREAIVTELLTRVR